MRSLNRSFSYIDWYDNCEFKALSVKLANKLLGMLIVLCTHCSKTFAADGVKAQRGSGLDAQIQCPHCLAWLGKSPILTRVKMVGFYLGIAAITYGYFSPSLRHITTPVAIFATMALLVSHMMDHLKVMEAPEVDPVDDSEHRKKYR